MDFKKYHGLRVDTNKNIIEGSIDFKCNFEGTRISDIYQIKIDFNLIDPLGLPSVFETGGKIKKIAAKHHVDIHDALHINSNDSFCITIPGDEKRIFKKGFSIQEFFSEAIEKFLFQMSYYDKNGYLPWGEYAHGDLGYIEKFAKNEITIEKLFAKINNDLIIKILLSHRQSICLCGSKYKFRKCHKLVFKGASKIKSELKKELDIF